MPDWGEALRITGVGLGVVFAVMMLVAVVTWLSGRAFVHFEGKQKAREQAAQAAAAAEAEAKEAVASDGGSA